MRPPVLRSFLRAARPPETFTLSLHDALPISVLAVLRKLGIAEGDLGAPDVGIHPEYDYRKGQRLIGYRVTRQMTAKVRDLDRLSTVLDSVVAAGADEVQGAQVSASDRAAAEHQALTAA